ncbi:histidine phosphatase family protein [Allokutzneria albata]|nr:histidine phosphatase family protein [Allokutzneria albata]
MPGHLILVRHAESVVPRPGGPDEFHRPLTETGLAQAENLVAELVSARPTLIVSSPYLRAVQTVEPLARAVGLPVRTRWELREWDSGLEPTPDYARYYAESWADPAAARPGGESLRQLTDRAVAALTALAGESDGGTVVVGSHGTFVARALVGFGMSTVDWEFSRAMPMPAIYRIEVS